MPLTLRRFDAPLGAEVIGLDLAEDMDEATFRAVEDAFNEYSVLVFRDQRLGEARQLAFSRREMVDAEVPRTPQ